MEPKRAELLSELNKDLEWEYAAAIQYVQHAALITGPEYESITKELIVHSQEEMQHAVMVSDQIAFLGGVPTVDVERRDISPESKTMLEWTSERGPTSESERKGSGLQFEIRTGSPYIKAAYARASAEAAAAADRPHRNWRGRKLKLRPLGPLTGHARQSQAGY